MTDKMPIKKCCDALEICYNASMVNFIHTPYLSWDINMHWNDLGKTVGGRLSKTCIFCGKKIEMAEAIL